MKKSDQTRCAFNNAGRDDSNGIPIIILMAAIANSHFYIRIIAPELFDTVIRLLILSTSTTWTNETTKHTKIIVGLAIGQK